jgi:Tfp pilus assembly protein PilO
VKAQTKKTTNLMVGGMIVVALLAAAFWLMLLSPKREEAKKLDARIETLEFSLSQHRSEAESAAAAKKAFPAEYQRLVVLGKAVPGGDETPSLLIQLSALANRSEVAFQNLTLHSGSGEGEEVEAAAGGFTSPTEAEAALLPLGASIGTAGLAVMPYELTFEGNFFQIAKFIEGVDKLVKTSNQNVAVNGRLITVNSFSLTPAEGEGGGDSSQLLASFSVTTFLTPPGQGLTAGASPAGPEETEATAAPAAYTTGATP